MIEIHCIVTGRVQGVMYRDFVRRNARRSGLTGYVRNLTDGTVEVVAHGDRVVLEKLIERMRHGPLLSRVQDVRVEWQEASGQYPGFEITY